MKGSITNFLASKYGISAHLQELDGHVDRNYLLNVNGIPLYILKLSRDLTSKSFLKAQHLIFEQLKTEATYVFPETLSGIDGEHIYLYTDEDGTQYLARILKYLPGEFLAESPKSPRLLYDFGLFLGMMDKALSYLHPAEIMARHYEWDLQYFSEYHDYTEHITDPSQRKIVEYFLLQFKEHIEPQSHRFRKSLIHNDANDWNILIDQDHISGAIDFGDVVYSFTVNEVAVGATYIALDSSDPLSGISNVLEGYNTVIPLKEIELDSMYYLIAARMCMSVCQSALRKKLEPENTYLSIHEASVWKLLEQWITISPDLAATLFRKSCGLPVKWNKNLQDYADRRQGYFSRALSVSYKKPIIMERAAFQYMFDREGKTYLDCVNNIMHVGHCHPHVVEAGQRQMAKLNTNTRYFYDALNSYAEKLLAKFPESLNKVFFVNSGSAASDLAIRLARAYTNRKDLIVMDYGYHGNTSLGIEISAYKFKGKGGKGAEPYIHTALLPGSDPGKDYTQKELDDRIDEFLAKPVAAFICEPIVGCGGQVMLDKGYLKSIYSKLREKGGICIADEVQTGFGRVGSTFWAYELYDVLPDIVVLGKPMGNGHPIGAVVTTSEVALAFENGMEFFSSFGGNPVSCAIGESVLDILETEMLQNNARLIGEHLINGFKAMQNDFEMIKEARGAGLFLGVELVKKGTPHVPATREAHNIINSMKARGILLSTDGPYNNVIKIKPPLCFNISNAHQLLTEFKNLMREFENPE